MLPSTNLVTHVLKVVDEDDRHEFYLTAPEAAEVARQLVDWKIPNLRLATTFQIFQKKHCTLVKLSEKHIERMAKKSEREQKQRDDEEEDRKTDGHWDGIDQWIKDHPEEYRELYVKSKAIVMEKIPRNSPISPDMLRTLIHNKAKLLIP